MKGRWPVEEVKIRRSKIESERVASSRDDGKLDNRRSTSVFVFSLCSESRS